MDLSAILLKIISKLDGERSIYAGLHLLRGKRSGQTLQDVEYYSLKSFFGILPKLSIESFDSASDSLKESGLISLGLDSIVYITVLGKENVESLPEYQFNGWDYRGKEHVFFSRVSLLVQTISHFRVNEKSFLPVQKEHEIQVFIKKLLVNKSIGDQVLATHVAWELKQALDRSTMSRVQKEIFTYRLSGYGATGLTWQQLSKQMKLNSQVIRLLFIEGLHRLLPAIEKSADLPFMRKLAEDVKVSSHLTESSQKTKELFAKGRSLDEIAEIRRLKISTIEDHFVEMSINDPHFPLTTFVSDTDVDRVLDTVKKKGTKRLRVLKYECAMVSYFQLRLILGARSGGKV
jgi:uncharacterized protein YpbB